MLLSGSPNMQHVSLSTDRSPKTMVAPRRVSVATGPYPDSNSHSSTSSPRSQKASVESLVSQTTQSSVPNTQTREFTPPSSIASSQYQHDSTQIQEAESGDEQESRSKGKKRTANGEIKDATPEGYRPAKHARNASTFSHSSSASLSELSQSLKTKLSYAMVKVQNGWQGHNLEEVESLASQSPQSVLSGFNRESLTSPRTAIAAMRATSNLSNLSNLSCDSITFSAVSQTQSEPVSTLARKTLAPPATITSGTRRRPTPNGHLQIHTMRPPQSTRPKPQQRTPSQNAAMEADAVETLLFMSTSPNNSGRFPSAFSPTSQTFSAQGSSTQTSPLKSQFSPIPRRLLRPYEDKSVLIDRLLHDLDDDTSEELDEAVKILDQHRAAKLAA